MNGQMTLSEKNALAQEFIKRVNPYEKTKPSYIVDLRAYAKYVKENNLNPHDITKEIMMKFVKQPQ